jgi:hypothetical protein
VSDRTLGELFSLNPREMNDEDRLDVIRRFREARDKWNSEKTAAKNEGRKKKTSRGTSVKTIGGVKIDDAFLDDLLKD